MDKDDNSKKERSLSITSVDSIDNNLYEGIFDTIDDSGNLVLKMDCGIKVIPAGDVYF